TLFSRERGFAFKTHCGNRILCAQARKAWRREMFERMELVRFVRVPTLWTVTNQPDLGDPAMVREFQRRLALLYREVARQWLRQCQPGYLTTRHARKLRSQWGTARVLRGRPGASFRIRVKEVGELGRQHAHIASDFDYINKFWLQEISTSSGLGFVQFSRKDNHTLRSAARFSGSRV